MVMIEVEGFRVSFSADIGWQVSDRTLKLRLETETESMPDAYYPNYENAVAEFVAKRLQGKVVELNKIVEPKKSVVY